jgi:ribosomal protein S18 acetylase RimI-like enzyme
MTRAVPVVVRGIREDEVDRLSAVTLDAYAGLDGIDVGEYRTTLADVADRAKRAVVLVAAEGDTVLGGVTYVPDATNPYAEFTDADAAGMRVLAVAPQAQGRGVGAALVRACVQRAQHAGRRRLVLHTTEAMVAAQRLYERFGFERASWRDWRPQPHILLLGYERVLERRSVGA